VLERAARLGVLEDLFLFGFACVETGELPFDDARFAGFELAVDPGNGNERADDVLFTRRHDGDGWGEAPACQEG
jgi:hypothetical protein